MHDFSGDCVILSKAENGIIEEDVDCVMTASQKVEAGVSIVSSTSEPCINNDDESNDKEEGVVLLVQITGILMFVTQIHKMDQGKDNDEK